MNVHNFKGDLEGGEESLIHAFLRFLRVRTDFITSHLAPEEGRRVILLGHTLTKNEDYRILYFIILRQLCAWSPKLLLQTLGQRKEATSDKWDNRGCLTIGFVLEPTSEDSQCNSYTLNSKLLSSSSTCTETFLQRSIRDPCSSTGVTKMESADIVWFRQNPAGSLAISSNYALAYPYHAHFWSLCVHKEKTESFKTFRSNKRHQNS